MTSLQSAIDTFNRTQKIGEDLQTYIDNAHAQYDVYVSEHRPESLRFGAMASTPMGRTKNTPVPLDYARVVQTLKPEYRYIFTDIYTYCDRLRYIDVAAFIETQLEHVIRNANSQYVVLYYTKSETIKSGTFFILLYLKKILTIAKNNDKYVFLLNYMDSIASKLYPTRPFHMRMDVSCEKELTKIEQYLFAVRGVDICSTQKLVFITYPSVHAKLRTHHNRAGVSTKMSSAHRKFGRLLNEIEDKIQRQTLNVFDVLGVLRDPYALDFVGKDPDAYKMWAHIESVMRVIESMEQKHAFDVLYLDDVSYSGEQIAKDLNSIRQMFSIATKHVIVYACTEVALRYMHDIVEKFYIKNVRVYTQRVLYSALVYYLYTPSVLKKLETPYTLHADMRLFLDGKPITNVYEITKSERTQTRRVRAENAHAAANVRSEYPYITYSQMEAQFVTDWYGPPTHYVNVLDARGKFLYYMNRKMPDTFSVHAPILFCVFPKDFIQDIHEYVDVSNRYVMHRLAVDTFEVDVSAAPVASNKSPNRRDELYKVYEKILKKTVNKHQPFYKNMTMT